MKNKILVMASLLPALTIAEGMWYNVSRDSRRGIIAEVRCRDKETDLERTMRDGESFAHLTPHGAFAIQEVSMAVCQHAIISCAATRAMCDHAHCMERCPMAKLDSYGFPSFKLALDIYDRGEASYNRKKCVRRFVLRALEIVGIDPGESVMRITDAHFDNVIDELKSTGKSDGTIAAYLGAFSAIGSKSLKRIYKAEGVRLPMFDIPEFKPERKEVVITSDEADVKLIQWMHDLRRIALDEKTLARDAAFARNRFVALWFQRLWAVRNNDVNRMKWGNIKMTPEGRVLAYTPHKTPYKTSDILIDQRTWLLVEPFVGKDNEYVIPREDFRGREKTAGGVYAGVHRYLWSDINRHMRLFGVEGHMASYQNRRRRITEAFAEGGYEASCGIGLNTPTIQNKHYIKQPRYRGGSSRFAA